MNRYICSLQRGLILILVLLLSACSPYKQSTQIISTEQLSKLHPHYVAVQRGRMEYYRFGQGSPIVLIPGYATDVSSWDRKFLATLGQHHQVIVLNNRNVGGSYVPSEHYESQDLAKDTYQLIEKLRLKKPAILGISMGGMIAQQLALLCPNKLGQLILINTAIAGKNAIHPSEAVEKSLIDMPQNKLGRYAIAIKLFFPPEWRAKMAVALATDRFQPENYLEINPIKTMPEQRRLVMDWLNDETSAKKITALHLPVLILNGQADIVIPPMNSVILARRIPGAKLLRWKDGGHAMIYQYPQQIANSVNDFIAKNS
ncbi:MAG: alpha/beta hydrolase [Gammaproteobacteria bacterium]|nr:alpha/beta hydrolase [Gammaproteobacteria bacterium]